MSEYNKQRYYWIKLTDNFMSSEVVDFLLSQKGGANYVVIYEMLCLKTVNNGGSLFTTIGEVIIPYDEAKIQRDLKWFSIDTIRVALSLYQRLGLIYEQSNGIFGITGFEDMVGSQTISAAKKQEQIKSREERKGGIIGGQQGGQEGGTKVENFPPEIKRLDNKIISHNMHACTHEENGEKSRVRGYNDFISMYPNVKKDVDLSDDILSKIDWISVMKAFKESDWLSSVDSLFWIIRNMQKILSGKYKTFKSSTSSKANHFSCERQYSEEDIKKLLKNVDDIEF